MRKQRAKAIRKYLKSTGLRESDKEWGRLYRRFKKEMNHVPWNKRHVKEEDDV